MGPWSHVKDDVIRWKHLLALCEGNQWIPNTKASDAGLMISLICAWTNGWANNWDACDLRRHRAHYDVTVMQFVPWCWHSTLLAPACKNQTDFQHWKNNHEFLEISLVLLPVKCICPDQGTLITTYWSHFVLNENQVPVNSDSIL